MYYWVLYKEEDLHDNSKDLERSKSPGVTGRMQRALPHPSQHVAGEKEGGRGEKLPKGGSQSNTSPNRENKKGG